MATKFHVNDDGMAGVCHAKQKCPFGDMNKDHYDSQEDAQAAYEQKMERQTQFAKTPLGKMDSKVKSLTSKVKNISAIKNWLGDRRANLAYDKIAAETGKDYRDRITSEVDSIGAMRARQKAADARFGTNVAGGAHS